MWVREAIDDVEDQELKEKVLLRVCKYYDSQNIKILLPDGMLDPISPDAFRVLIIAGVTTMTQRYVKNGEDQRVDPSLSGELMKFTNKPHAKMGSLPIEHVIDRIMEVTEDDVFDVILLACDQTHVMADQITRKSVGLRDTGVVIFFGENGEERLDGGARWLMEDCVEKFVEILMERLPEFTPGDEDFSKSLFRDLYKRLGEDYVAPKKKEMEMAESGDYKYPQYFLDMSAHEVRNIEGFVDGLHQGGILRAYDMDGYDLVCEDLMEDRKEYFESLEHEDDEDDSE